MRVDLLNRLIEAQKLTSDELTIEKIEIYVDAVNLWREQVLDTIVNFTNTLSHEERLAVTQLEVYNAALIERLTSFLKQLKTEQQQLMKQNLAISAYNKAR